MKISIHAGHNPDGLPGAGAVGYLKESTCAREIVAQLYDFLRDVEGVEVEDHTVNNGTGQNNVLRLLADRINAFSPDVAISIHLNSAATEDAEGVETWSYPGNSEMLDLGGAITNKLSLDMGYKDRGQKKNGTLFIIRKTVCPCIIIECGFVSNREDCEKYDAEEIAYAITKAIMSVYGLAQKLPEDTEEREEDYPDALKRIQVGAFRSTANAQAELERVKAAGWTDAFITT